ncbi:unnamed protein product [Caenorhabditis auriculariae]|uniref:7TM GPCR serpentine receptor class x (Srx) domain-containing protein n=1 Tax=Caenorhabditis auriculariae TaxID=2777116 RepID=A0A8S1GV26_9PELO|nr:unnamed protein product [Caenorhabditis auriculariae]
MTFLEVVSALSFISLVYGDGLVCYGTERALGREYASLERIFKSETPSRSTDILIQLTIAWPSIYAKATAQFPKILYLFT